jgi:hypothetical protein
VRWRKTQKTEYQKLISLIKYPKTAALIRLADLEIGYFQEGLFGFRLSDFRGMLFSLGFGYFDAMFAVDRSLTVFHVFSSLFVCLIIL